MPSHHGADEDEFFERRSFSSAKKTAILERFFKAWASIVSRHSNRLLYIDLYAGPGSYKKDELGNASTAENPVYSTPVRIVKGALAEKNFAKSLVCIFNDGNGQYIKELEAMIQSLPQRAGLAHEPQYFCGMVSDEIASAFAQLRLAPALFFVDPFGYSGLTRELIHSVLKDWGSDCVIFFNYDRINRAFGRDTPNPHLDALFGGQRVADMRRRLRTLRNPLDRELFVLEQFFEALAEIEGTFCIHYRFRAASGRTKHHLVFTSKNWRGYDVMKNAMAQESTETSDSVPTYEFVEPRTGEPALFQSVLPPRRFPWSIQQLCADLEVCYKTGKHLFSDIVKEHGVGKPYIEKNYRTAVLRLLEDGKVELRKADGKPPRKNSCPLETWIRFL